jgi:TPP-dependent pyruvate/acetoin dehydrogenase alpha subunit
MWSQKDPIKILRDRMVSRGHLTEEEFKQLEIQEQTLLDDIAEQLIKQRHELTLDEAYSYIYADGGNR